ncbi:MAG: site-specific DNA-methyltransferase [Bacteroidales bacterium]|nr:site-specific DNA-methyltransferase [Bacteroidales bacterium]MCF8387408.1 site-specific DNA-methyltransferase [Bacteroidales bacterium]MCF8397317.1 site-specific DNA-methyltransferase [Bacteroidales bacterium]
MAINPQVNFKNLLTDLFQLDKSDLDFGIYRIINTKHDDIEMFLDEILPQTLKEVKEKLTARSQEEILKELQEAKEKLEKDFKVDFTKNEDLARKADQYGQIPLFQEPYKKYLDAKEKLDKAKLADEVENDIYNELYRFFNRYYDEGDFVTKPRSGDNAYMIPYNGEEVKLYWANYDQYYIKTGENFKNYTFKGEGVTIEFRLKEAETSKNNNQNQKGRLFIPAEEWFHWSKDEKKLELHFYYKVPGAEEKKKWGEKQSVKKDNKGINENLIVNLLPGKIAETRDAGLMRLWEKEGKTIGKDKVKEFYYHLHRYTSLNKADYFIHKNLKKFLSQELDYYLKKEVLSIDFLDPKWEQEQVQKAIEINLTKSSAIRKIAFTIIDFLHELEEFQKRLFEKKKFVVQSDYCMTFDRIPEKVYEEIIGFILKDKEQRQLQNWVELGFIENTDIDKEYIKEHDKLVLDTAFLPAKLKLKLLSQIENLDEKSGGILINSENWQGLNLLQQKYKEKVKCIYIDPPYNAKSSEIAYKNSFKHASWLSLMQNRLVEGKKFLKPDGVNIIAIDENEQEKLGLSLDDTFSPFIFDKVCVSIIHNPGGIQGDNFKFTNDFAYFVFKKGGKVIGLQKRTKDDADIRPLRDVSFGDHLREDAANCFYPIFIKDNEIVGFGEVCDDSFHPESANIKKDDGIIEVYPIDPNNVERKWVFARNTVEEIKDELKVEFNKVRKIYDIIRIKQIFNFKTVWYDKRYNSNIYGSKVLNNLLPNNIFKFPKSLYTVIDSIDAGLKNSKSGFTLDHFAGSATTGHAVFKLNKEDGGNRKYILMEMGEYFDTVTKPRIQKVMYSDNWKDGKPKDMDGSSHMFQYLKLEQYEDTLNNIEFSEIPEGVQELPFSEQIKYMLHGAVEDSSSLMNIRKFTKPFSYEMDIVKLNEREPKKVDLVSTFNFLLGIFLNRYLVEEHQERDYQIVLGEKDKQKLAIIWREFDEKLDLDKEKEWIKKQAWSDKKEYRLFCNVDNSFGAESTEKEFFRLMWEGIAYE